MKTHSMLWRNFDYDNWSNRRVLQTLEEMEPPCGESLQIMGHILHTKRMWLLRVRDEKTIGYEVRPRVMLEDCSQMVDELGREYADYLSGIGYAELQQGVRYHDRKGIPHATILFDVLTGMLYHGATHRGEILQLLRRSGHTPPGIDYITYAREEYVESEGREILTPDPGL